MYCRHQVLSRFFSGSSRFFFFNSFLLFTYFTYLMILAIKQPHQTGPGWEAGEPSSPIRNLHTLSLASLSGVLACSYFCALYWHALPPRVMQLVYPYLPGPGVPTHACAHTLGPGMYTIMGRVKYGVWKKKEECRLMEEKAWSIHLPYSDCVLQF